MNISQVTLNTLVTITLLVYCMFMFTLAWCFNRPLDLNNFLILVTPLISQVIHNIAYPSQKASVTP